MPETETQWCVGGLGGRRASRPKEMDGEWGETGEGAEIDRRGKREGKSCQREGQREGHRRSMQAVLPERSVL